MSPDHAGRTFGGNQLTLLDVQYSNVENRGLA